MTTILVQFIAPEEVEIDAGEYEVFEHGQRIRVEYPPVLYRADTNVEIHCEGLPVFSAEYFSDIQLHEFPQIESECRRCEEITLRAVNRLLMWYRFHTKRYYIRKLVLSQLTGIITFTENERKLVCPRDYNNSEPLGFVELTPSSWAQLRMDLRSTSGPPVADILLLDAKAALAQHLYRECVIVAWNAIEYVFDPFIRRCLQQMRPGISEETLQNFERDLHFLNRADTLMELLTGFSFRYSISLEFWQMFTSSRNKRNNLVHRGEDATVEDARNALFVAEQIMEQIRLLETS